MIILLALQPVLIYGQDLNLGAKFGFGFTSTDFEAKEFMFSNVENEIAYMTDIKSEKMFIGPVFNMNFKSRNRLGIHLDLFTFTNTYEILTESSLSLVEFAPEISTPKLSTFYVNLSFGFTYDIVQTKIVRPYLRAGASLNGLLAVDELDSDIDGTKFSNQLGREVRNAIMYDYLNQQNTVYYSANVGLGLRVYNFYVEGIIDKNLTDIDAIGAYAGQSKLIINIGINLIRLDLVKKQKSGF